MNCPVCDDVRMKEVQKDDVLIDVCPACKGVWLDRGELEKLLQGVREVRDDYERMEQQMHDPAYGQPSTTPGGAPGQSAAFGGGSTGQPVGGFGSAPGQGQQGFGGAPAPGQGQPGYGTAGQGYGQNPGTGYGGQQQGGGYPPPPGNYNQPGYGQPSGQGYGHGHSKYGYDKYGRPYKKKKTVLDVFGDLFD